MEPIIFADIRLVGAQLSNVRRQVRRRLQKLEKAFTNEVQPAAPAEVSGGDNLGGMPPAARPLGPPIGRGRMWNGAEPVRRMRSLHVCAGFATAGLFLAVPLTSGPHRGVGQTFLALMIVALAGPVIALLLPWLWRRQDPADGTADEEPRLSPDRPTTCRSPRSRAPPTCGSSDS